MLKKYLKQILQWGVAGVIAVLICNFLLLFYHRPSGWIVRENSSTTAIWNPNSTFLMGTEGRAIHNVDKRGYLNPDLPLAEEYSVIVGSSHAQGKEVPSGCRYTDLLNERMRESDTELAVYNCSQDSYYLPNVIEGFYAITNEFKDSSNIIIGISKSDVKFSDLEDSLEQRDYDSEQTGDKVYSALSAVEKMEISVKESFPILALVKKNLMTYLKTQESSNELVSNEVNYNQYEKLLDSGMQLMRSQYSGGLYIVYHPKVHINSDGEMEIIEWDLLDIIKKCCEKNNIIFIDVSDAFLEEYARNYNVPYGFFNTTMGEGHLNKCGHQLIANEIYDAMNGGNEE